MTRAVILDDGVYDGFLPIPTIAERWLVEDEGRVVPDNTTPYQSHGTICAAVIEALCPGQEFISVRILNDDRCGYIDHLVTALCWCRDNDIQLIHMSLGTADYRDVPVIRPIVAELLDSGTILVAAHSNFLIPSTPANLPGVFSVRGDREERLRHSEIAVDIREDLMSENALVAHFDTETLGLAHSQANSFATPVVTARLLHFLRNNPNASHAELWTALTEDAVSIPNLSPYRAYAKWTEFKVSIPIIQVVADSEHTFERLLAMFRKDDYTANAFSRKEHPDTDVLPLGLYADTGLPPGLVMVLTMVYRSDICLFELERDVPPDWKQVDVLVEARESRYIVMTDKYAVFPDTLRQVYQVLLRRFEASGMAGT